MNILFLTSTFPRHAQDDQAPFVLEQAQFWLKAYPDDEIHRFTYWWPREWQYLAYPAILPNLTKNLLLIFQLPALLIAEFFATLKIVKKYKIKLIYAHWTVPQGVVSFFIHKITKTNYVVQNHSSDLRILESFPIVGRLLSKQVLKSAKKVFCVNSRLQKEAMEVFDSHDPILQKKIIVLPMGINPETCLTEEEERNNHHDFDFGMIGRLSKKKGIAKFLISLRQLKEENISLNVAIAGDGEERSTLENLSAGLNVRFLGFLSGKEKSRFFNKVRFMVFPSLAAKGDVEGLPVALLESLYSGKIIIASRSTNIELIPEWQSIKEGIYILNDANDTQELARLIKLLRDLKLDEMNRISKKIRKVMQRYNWQNLIQEYVHQITLE
jgi:glycosyltransferase involved in cell wall biosynthesis